MDRLGRRCREHLRHPRALQPLDPVQFLSRVADKPLGQLYAVGVDHHHSVPRGEIAIHRCDTHRQQAALSAEGSSRSRIHHDPAVRRLAVEQPQLVVGQTERAGREARSHIFPGKTGLEDAGARPPGDDRLHSPARGDPGAVDLAAHAPAPQRTEGADLHALEVADGRPPS